MSAGFNIVSKVSLDKGMSRYVLVVYGHAFGTLATALLVLLFESAVLGRTLYYAGMEYTSPAFASAMGNLIPSFTFVLALLCRMEKLEIWNVSSQAKIGGTLVALAGATLMTIYKGIVVISPHTRRSHEPAATSSRAFLDWEWIKGSLMLATSSLSFAAFYILQTTTLKKYPAPLTITWLMCLSGTLLAAIMTLIFDHKVSSWRLSWDISLIAPIYCGTAGARVLCAGVQVLPMDCHQLLPKDGLNATPSTFQLLQNFANLPMVGKPLYGVVSDAVYIGGSHDQGTAGARVLCAGVQVQVLPMDCHQLLPQGRP
ncbi:WAT1-related protein At5g07050 [Vitis vinifera]|uniref:WAT1-related protein At5g07050 n=1 Tax=Vitis vinifera TaxID=29760 RepID=UPI0008FF87E9|nr:WAT1-related protein At5g07050 [Vitis vinifera]|eukprot:XP_019074425.1 PREDICTED: WAT1-related protein At5g07050 [Vitis vinifera]